MISQLPLEPAGVAVIDLHALTSERRVLIADLLTRYTSHNKKRLIAV